MTPYAALYSALGSLVSNKVHPKIAPQSAVMPFVVITQVDSPRVPQLKTRTQHRRPRFQIDVYAATHDAADTLATSIKGVLEGQKGELVTGFTTEGTHLVDESHEIEEPTDGIETAKHRIRMDFIMWYHE